MRLHLPVRYDDVATVTDVCAVFNCAGAFAPLGRALARDVTVGYVDHLFRLCDFQDLRRFPLRCLNHGLDQRVTGPAAWIDAVATGTALERQREQYAAHR